MKSRWIAILLALLLLIFAGVYIYQALDKPKRKPVAPAPQNPVEQYEPKFRRDGSLQLIDRKNDTLMSLEIEVVDNEYGITTGLMYRKQMAANRGMLFVFPDVRMRSFWMKNTHIPLDIIFIAENKTIVTIQKNTKPFSEASIPSSAEAKYVLEVNAGTADRIGLKEGDRIAYTLDKK